jgi:hypothetical protein
LTLLVSYCSLTHRGIRANFHLLYDAYTAFYAASSIGGGASMQHFSEHQAMMAFESLLIDQALLVWYDAPPLNAAGVTDAAYAGRTLQKRFMHVGMIITQEELRTALKNKVVHAPTWLVQWASKAGE